MKYPLSYQLGLSAIEMLITIVVAALFILAFNTLFVTLGQSSAMTRYQSTANDLAYSNLRKYVSAGTTPTWFSCDTRTGSSNINDIVRNPNATGQVLDSGTLSASQSNLPSPVSYQITAIAPYGCNGTNAGKPLVVTSSVTYGANNAVVKHATYTGFE